MNNPPPDPAVGSEGASPSPMLAELYKTLGSVQAGIETRQQEARTARTQALQVEQSLLADRQQAVDAEDADAFDTATAGLDEVKRILDMIDNDLGATDAADEQHDGSGDSDSGHGDSDPDVGGGRPTPPGAAAGSDVRPDADDAGDGDADRS